MSHWNRHLENEDSFDDGPLVGSPGDRKEARDTKLRVAQDIASGIVMGTFERDEEVWQMVREIGEKK